MIHEDRDYDYDDIQDELRLIFFKQALKPPPWC